MPAKLAPEEQRTGKLLAFCTPHEIDRIKDWASGLDRTVSSAVRLLVLREVKKTERRQA